MPHCRICSGSLAETSPAVEPMDSRSNAANKPAMLSEFVEVGADVAVTYSETGASRHAAKVMVLWAPAPLSAEK